MVGNTDCGTYDIARLTDVSTSEEYVIVDQTPYRLIVHRGEERGRPVLYSGPETSVELRSIGLSLPLARSYAGVPGGLAGVATA